MLGYIHTGHVGGDLATTLEEQVRHANAEEAWKEQGYAQGEEAGEALAQKRMSSLIAKLSQEGRLSDLGSVADDPDVLEALMVDNGI